MIERALSREEVKTVLEIQCMHKKADYLVSVSGCGGTQTDVQTMMPQR